MVIEHYASAATAIRNAEALLICAGAGIGVDSGLPDFRGDQGFWKAYPPYAKLGLGFIDLANPEWFHKDPALAWGFYGHRLMLYRRTAPHAGFQILLKWAHAAQLGAYVFTSNVDGHFQHAGFATEQVTEVHGSIHHLQCLADCGAGVFSTDGIDIDVDEASFRAREPLPKCPRCGGPTRPNVLMFGDDGWDNSRSAVYSKHLYDWLKQLKTQHLVIIEIGAGTAVPIVRLFTEHLAHVRRATLIRINVREFDVPPGQIGIAAGALEALQAIDRNQSL